VEATSGTHAPCSYFQSFTLLEIDLNRHTSIALTVTLILGALSAFANEEVRTIDKFYDLPVDVPTPIVV
jgi:hypothetical protein